MFEYQNLKGIYILVFECFEHMDPFLWNILKFTKKLKQFGEHLIMKKDFWNKEITCAHVFLCVLNIEKDFWNMVNFHKFFVVTTLKV
jgi:hypothetical protein